MFHGQTIIRPTIDGMKNQETAASDYVHQVNGERRVSKSMHQELATHPAPKRCQYAFIDGTAVKRHESWGDDYFLIWHRSRGEMSLSPV